MAFLEIVVGLIVIIVLGLVVMIYNGLVVLRNNINKAWADIDVLLEQRHDELSKLIDTVSGYAKYEKKLQTQVTQLRSAWQKQTGTLDAKIDSSNQVSTALKSIFAVAENYPDLKADQSFIQLQQRISTLESELADRREFYNDSVNTFNIRIQQIPYSILANMLSYKTMPMFQVPEEAKADVKVNIDV